VRRSAVVLALATGLLVPVGPAAAERHLPRISVTAASLTEGGTTRVVLSLDRAPTRPLSVRLDTRAVTALARRDYAPVHEVIAIPAGHARVVIPVPTVADGLDEADESFRVWISDPVHAVLDDDRTTVEIRDADPRPGVAPQDASIQEPVLGNRLGFTEVRLSAPSGRRVVVTLVPKPGSAHPGDYVTLHPTAVFAPGETSQVVSIEVLADDKVEGPEIVRLVVESARHARPTRRATITILDADSRFAASGRMGA
jgi:hypothetical protein